ncbi:MAG: hypothetical protein Q4P14_06285 [Methanobacteriaceae archaeon]|nr:hypothetical protein [Methanobacteriaceae archaeon]
MKIYETQFDELEGFLRENFKLNDNFDDVILYLRRNPELIKHVYKIPSLYSKEFPGEELFIDVNVLFDDPILRAYVKTSCDGFEACDKLSLLEDSFYVDDFALEKFLLTVRPK